MKKNLNYEIKDDMMVQNADGQMAYRVQKVEFTKKLKDDTIRYSTRIANLLLTIIQKSLKRTWSFSGLATMVRILLMYYIDFNSFFEHPEKDWKLWLEQAIKPPIEPSLF